MASEIVRHLTPEEEELLRKREELAAVKAALAERDPLACVPRLRSMLAEILPELREVAVRWLGCDKQKCSTVSIAVSATESLHHPTEPRTIYR